MSKGEPSVGERVVVKRTNKPRFDGWTPARREVFLIALAQSCNVKQACELVGLSQNSAYTLRKRDPGFRGEWRLAIAESYARHEMMQLERMLLGEAKLREAMVDVEARDALDMLNRFHMHVTDPAPRHRAMALDVDLGDDDPDGSEARASINAKLVKLRAHLAREADRAAQTEPVEGGD